MGEAGALRRARRRAGGGGDKMAVAGRGAAAVKPIFSRDLGEAKRRVRELYRAWYREVPNTGEGASEGRRGRRPRVKVAAGGRAA